MDAVTAPSLHWLVRDLGRQPYEPIWRGMQAFTDARDEHTPDELWLVEHDPVFTLGQAGKWEHVLLPGDIPVVPVDRGGQVTYHGPGQLVAYPLLDLRRAKIGVRELVDRIEQSIIDVLAEWNITGERRCGAPGVYVADAKIAALGLRSLVAGQGVCVGCRNPVHFIGCLKSPLEIQVTQQWRRVYGGSGHAQRGRKGSIFSQE